MVDKCGRVVNSEVRHSGGRAGEAHDPYTKGNGLEFGCHLAHCGVGRSVPLGRLGQKGRSSLINPEVKTNREIASDRAHLDLGLC